MSWTVDVTPDGARVVAVFKGRLTADEGLASARAFGDALRQRQLDVVWDLRGMSGYESAAREAWQEAIWPNRKNIRSLTLIGAKAAVRAGALMLAAFIGAPWQFQKAPEGGMPSPAAASETQSPIHTQTRQ